MKTRLVMLLHDTETNTAQAFFVDVIQGEVRIRGAAKWDIEKFEYVPAEFDVVKQEAK